jgi:hypothetical protein
MSEPTVQEIADELLVLWVSRSLEFPERMVAALDTERTARLEAEQARDEARTLAQVGTWHNECRPNRHMAARELAKSQAVINKLADRISELEAHLNAAIHNLAECYRLTGANPDGNEDWRLAEDAVAEVQRLRKNNDAADARLQRLTDGLIALRLKNAYTTLPDAIVQQFDALLAETNGPEIEDALANSGLGVSQAKG